MKKIILFLVLAIGLAPMLTEQGIRLSANKVFSQEVDMELETVVCMSNPRTTTDIYGDWIVTTTCTLVLDEIIKDCVDDCHTASQYIPPIDQGTEPDTVDTCYPYPCNDGGTGGTSGGGGDPVSTEKTWFLDNDGDGYYGSSVLAANQPSNGNWKSTTSGKDCDDSEYSLNNVCCPIGMSKDPSLPDQTSSCKENFNIIGIIAKDSKNRKAEEGEILYVLDDNKNVTITSKLDKQIQFPHHITTANMVNVISVYPWAVNGNPSTSGGWPSSNSSYHEVGVRVLEKISYTPKVTFNLPGAREALDAVARASNVIGEKTSFNLNISIADGDNEVDPNSRFIRTFKKYSGTFGFTTSTGEVGVPGWSFQTPASIPIQVEAGLFLSASGSASATLDLKKYTLNNGSPLEYYTDPSVTISGNAEIKATIKASVKTDIWLLGECSAEVGCAGTVSANLTATANDGTINATLSVGKLEGELYYEVVVEDITYSGSVSHTMFDGFKLLDNKEVFNY